METSPSCLIYSGINRLRAWNYLEVLLSLEWQLPDPSLDPRSCLLLHSPRPNYIFATPMCQNHFFTVPNYQNYFYFRIVKVSNFSVEGKCTAQKFSIKDFFSKCDQIRSFLYREPYITPLIMLKTELCLKKLLRERVSLWNRSERNNYFWLVCYFQQLKNVENCRKSRGYLHHLLVNQQFWRQ